MRVRMIILNALKTVVRQTEYVLVVVHVSKNVPTDALVQYGKIILISVQ